MPGSASARIAALLLSPPRRILRKSRLARSLASRYLPARPPWVEDIEGKHRLAVAAVLADGENGQFFATRKALPPEYGAGVSERVIELPWVLAQQPRGKILDAGSSLNHREYLAHFRPLADELHIVTFSYEGTSYMEQDISYLFADLRHLPYRDGYFNTVVSISTLEHVGMDNSAYGVDLPSVADPRAEVDSAVRELARVVARGGLLLLTFPYGAPKDLGRWRQFDRSDVERVISVASASDAQVTVYRSAPRGWDLSDLESSADARYRDEIGAEAVACLRLSY
jgi:hypothetical protein